MMQKLSATRSLCRLTSVHHNFQSYRRTFIPYQPRFNFNQNIFSKFSINTNIHNTFAHYSTTIDQTDDEISAEAKQLNKLLLKLIEAKRYNAVEFTFQEAKREIKLHDTNYNVYMNSYAKQGNPEKCEAILKEMMENNFKPSVYTYTILMDAYVRRNRMRAAKEVLRRMKEAKIQPNATTLKTLINGYAQHGKMSQAIRIVIEEMKANKIPFDIQLFNILIKGYVVKRDMHSAIEVMVIMQEYDIKPDEYSFATLINGWLKMKNVEAALEGLEGMKRLMKPTLIIYNTFIQYYMSVGDFQSVQKMLDEMKENQIDIHNSTIHIIMEGYINLKKYEEAEKVFHEMTQNIRPDFQNFLDLLRIYTKTRNINKAIEILRRIKLLGMEIKHQSLTFILNELILQDLEEGLLLLKEMQRTIDFLPSESTYRCLLKMYCKVNVNIEKAKELLEKLERNKVDYNAREMLLVGYYNAGQIETGFAFLNSLIEEGHFPSTVSMGIILKRTMLYLGLEEAIKLYHFCKNQGVYMDLVCCNTILDGFCKSHLYDEAFEFIENENIVPDVFTYNILMNGFINAEQPEKAIEIYEKIFETGKIRPDSNTFSIVLQAYVKKGEEEKMEKVFDTLKQMKIPITEIFYNQVIGYYVRNQNLQKAKQYYKEAKRSNLKIAKGLINYLE